MGLYSSTLLGKSIHSSKILLNFLCRCGHCKEFDPIYKKVAKKMLKNNENIVFGEQKHLLIAKSYLNKTLFLGKMDGTANDIPYMFPPIKVIVTLRIKKREKEIQKFNFRASLQCSSSLHMRSMTQSSIKGTGPTSQSRTGLTGDDFSSIYKMGPRRNILL